MNRLRIIKDLKTLDFMENIDKYKVTEVLSSNPDFNIKDEIFKTETFETGSIEEAHIFDFIDQEYGLEYYLKKSRYFTTFELAEIAGLNVLNTNEIDDTSLLIKGIGKIKNPYYILIDGVAHFLNDKTLRSKALESIRERLNNESCKNAPQTVLEAAK